jgi:hypothetical protein
MHPMPAGLPGPDAPETAARRLAGFDDSATRQQDITGQIDILGFIDEDYRDNSGLHSMTLLG